MATAMATADVVYPTSYDTTTRPKPPLNAYASFHKHYNASDKYKNALAEMGPTKAVGAPMKLTSEAWAELPEAEKDVWKADAKAAKEAYNLLHYGVKHTRVQESKKPLFPDIVSYYIDGYGYDRISEIFFCHAIYFNKYHPGGKNMPNARPHS